VKKNINFKRLVRKYEYLTEELGDIEEMLSSIDSTFKTTIIDNGYTFKNYDEEVVTGETSDKGVTEINNTLPPKFKKLFRKMVVKCHPDKLGESDNKTDMVGIYDKVIIAQKNSDLGGLVMLAIKLEMDVSEFEDEIVELEKSCNNLDTQISQHTNSSIWYWDSLETDEEKEDFLKKYIKVALSKNVIFKK
jgi:hypothetical protein